MADTPAPDMYERLYWEIQAVLDEVLGADDDGASEAGIVSDVRRALAKVRAEERARLESRLTALENAAERGRRWREQHGVAPWADVNLARRQA